MRCKHLYRKSLIIHGRNSGATDNSVWRALVSDLLWELKTSPIKFGERSRSETEADGGWLQCPLYLPQTIAEVVMNKGDNCAGSRRVKWRFFVTRRQRLWALKLDRCLNNSWKTCCCGRRFNEAEGTATLGSNGLLFINVTDRLKMRSIPSTDTTSKYDINISMNTTPQIILNSIHRRQIVWLIYLFGFLESFKRTRYLEMRPCHLDTETRNRYSPNPHFSKV